MIKRNSHAVFVGLLMCLTLVGCGKRKDLTASDFPLIDDGLSESKLVEKVGAPHEKIKGYLDIAQIETQLFSRELGSGQSNMDFEKSWDTISGGDPDVCYVYRLKGDKEQAMFAFILDKQVIMITRSPVNYES